jgi:hypothetical protein
LDTEEAERELKKIGFSTDEIQDLVGRWEKLLIADFLRARNEQESEQDD